MSERVDPKDRVIASLSRLRTLADDEQRRRGRSQPRNASVIEHCEQLSARLAPEYHFIFRLPFELLRLIDLPLPPPPPGGYTIPDLACVRIRAGLLSLAADFRYDQTWRFERLNIGDISSSISLAPSEQLTLSIRKTQRTQLTETTLQSSESLDSFESTVVDKDVLNVARSTARTQQWHVDANASVSIGGVFSFGSSGGLSGSVTDASNATVEHLSESTEKSARRLQTLQKIEVARQTEVTVEDIQKRTITNPYRDRALTLNVYELNKRFNVTTELAEIRPVLVLEITDLDLGRDFVLSQGDFLDEAVVDRTLIAELREALRVARTPISTQHRDLARRYARLAFHFLFENTNLFHLDGDDANENDPWQSFADNDGLEDTISNALGKVFTTLGTYLRMQAAIYSAPPFGPPPLVPLPPPWPGPLGRGHDLEIDVAIALADSIRDEWKALMPDDTEDLMDTGSKTEVVRRIAGFLSIVDGLLKPLIKPLTEETEAAEASRRADDVIGRVVSHLGCNKAFYVSRFLEYIYCKTNGYALGDVLYRVLATGQVAAIPPNQISDLLRIFNPRAGYLDGFQYVVPTNHLITLGNAVQWINDIIAPNAPPQIGLFAPVTIDVVVPTDGFHLEPIAGQCVLRDLPDPQTSATVGINVEAHGT